MAARSARSTIRLILRILPCHFAFLLLPSELFVVSLADWVMIDNIVIDNESLHTTTTPTTPPPLPDWVWIVIVGGVTVGVIVLAIVFLRRR